MTYPEPISTDRYYPTDNDCQDGSILGFDDGQWKFMSPESLKMRGLKWWLRVPPKPVEAGLDAAEQAWQEHLSHKPPTMLGHHWPDFRAGYEAGRKAKA